MYSERLGLTDLQEQIRDRFYRAFSELPVYGGDTMVLLPKEEEAVERAHNDSYALCEEMEDDEILLYDDEIRVLAMIAAIDITREFVPAVFLNDNDGRNFND